MKAVVVTETGKNIGLGHLTRCLSICKELVKAGVKVCFIINERPILNNNFDLAIVDSYRLARPAYVEIQQKTGLLVCFDDNKRLDYPKGIVINGAVYARELNYPDHRGIGYLLGPRYMPLRKEFSRCGKKPIKEKIESILITFGGTDFREMSSKVVNFILSEYPDTELNVLVGPAFSGRKILNKRRNGRVSYYRGLNAGDTIKLMQGSDIAISAGGQTLYELACTGTPTLGVSVADNQLNNLYSWARIGFLKYCGWHDDRRLFHNIEKGVCDIHARKTREKMSRLGQRLIDGRGAQRIAAKILASVK